MKVPVLCVILSMVCPVACWGQDVGSRLGDAYAKASPGEKLAMLAIAKTDKTLNANDVARGVHAVAIAEVRKGKTAEERLKLFGDMRKVARESLRKTNAERRTAKKRYARPADLEPPKEFQQALALDYLSAVAGPSPDLEKLSQCLALVRASTSWTAHNWIVLSAAQEAFARDEAYMKANMREKLNILRKYVVDRKMLDQKAQAYLQNCVLTSWMNVELKAGHTAEWLRAELKKLKKAKLICADSHDWASDMLKGLHDLREQLEGNGGKDSK